MTARRPERVYPVRVQSRDLALHRLSLATLTAVNDTWPGSRAVEEMISALGYRIACAERWEAMKEKRLTDEQTDILRHVLLGAVVGGTLAGDAARASAAARSLVRATRGWRPPARPPARPLS